MGARGMRQGHVTIAARSVCPTGLHQDGPVGRGILVRGSSTIKRIDLEGRRSPGWLRYAMRDALSRGLQRRRSAENRNRCRLRLGVLPTVVAAWLVGRWEAPPGFSLRAPRSRGSARRRGASVVGPVVAALLTEPATSSLGLRPHCRLPCRGFGGSRRSCPRRLSAGRSDRFRGGGRPPAVDVA